jgi:hypothetical protein
VSHVQWSLIYIYKVSQKLLTIWKSILNCNSKRFYHCQDSSRYSLFSLTVLLPLEVLRLQYDETNVYHPAKSVSTLWLPDWCRRIFCYLKMLIKTHIAGKQQLFDQWNTRPVWRCETGAVNERQEVGALKMLLARCLRGRYNDFVVSLSVIPWHRDFSIVHFSSPRKDLL